MLTGAGDVFCTGGDTRRPHSSADRLEFARAHNDLAQATSRLGKPLVAAINGDAHAGGFSLIALCDLAVCAEDATLGLPEAAHGLFPLLALAIVKDSLPQKVFFDLVYRARLLNASEAQSLHLVNEVVPRPRVVARAIELAPSTPDANPKSSASAGICTTTRAVQPLTMATSEHALRWWLHSRRGRNDSDTQGDSAPRSRAARRPRQHGRYLHRVVRIFYRGRRRRCIRTPVSFPLLVVGGYARRVPSFAVGFVARPVGGMVFGHIGDRSGRKDHARDQ